MARDSVGWRASFAIKDKAVEKILKAKDPQFLALLFLEFLLSMIIVLAIVIYLDPNVNVIQPPFNIIIFAFIIFAVIRVYNYTLDFRLLRGMKKESSLRQMLLELFMFAFVIASAFIYQDEGVNLLPYPFNIFAFLLILAVPLYFYVNEKFVKSEP